MRRLFGEGSKAISIELPSGVGTLSSLLPKEAGLTSDYWIDQHTLYSYYAFSFSKERAGKIRAQLKSAKGHSVHLRTGVASSPIPANQAALFCPLCLQDDLKQYGETYWHRSHQIPGVQVCVKHNVWLEKSAFIYKGKYPHYAFISATRKVLDIPPREAKTEDRASKFHLQLAKDAIWLLNHDLSTLEPAEIRRRYVYILRKQGLATSSGHLRHKEIQQRFREFYPLDFLRSINCEPKEDTQTYWLARILRNRKSTFAPLQHLLVIHFLGETASSLVEKTIEYAPFGKAPWPCLNKTCKVYRQFEIQHVDIHYSENFPVGTFRCIQCGFTYSRRGPDLKPEDRFRRARIKDVGHVWKKRLNKLMDDPQISFEEKGRQLGVDPQTVQRYEKIFSSEEDTRVLEKQISLGNKKEQLRKTWSSLVKENPDKGVTTIRKLSPSTYIWLYRNDRQWLKQHSPKSKKSTTRKSRTDWQLRDKELSKQIYDYAEERKVDLGKPIRLTKTGIGNGLDIRTLLIKHLDKLPLCEKTLVDVVEDRLTFGLRRIAWAKKYCQENNLNLNPSQFIRLAGVDRMKNWPEIKAVL